MKKRKKYPRLPNAFGSIRYLGAGRRNPYAVHPPAKLADDLGDYVRPAALCYVNDWYVGFAVLNAYHAGTYTQGDELKFQQYRTLDSRELDDFCQRILADYAAHSQTENIAVKHEKTFEEVFNLFWEFKYGENNKKQLSKQSKDAMRAAYKNCHVLHKRVFKELRHKDLQDCIDGCTLRSASINNMVLLIRQMYKYALLYELCEKDYSAGLRMPKDDCEHGVPFSNEELKILWANKDNPVIEFVLIMCYSGYRITAYKTLDVNLHDWYFQGGLKTPAGKGRIVPIHSAIRGLVTRRINRDGCMLNESTQTYRESMYKALSALGIEKHTPHDCRHTFSTLCERYGVRENDRKRMMGHSFKEDLTNKTYGHRTVEELRHEIEKIKVCPSCD